MILGFLADNPQWQILPLEVSSPYSIYSTPQGWLKVWPHRWDMDGFFMVRLRKTNDSE